MSVKIINVLKDDSFNDILELFRQSSATEVILVLPRVGKLFHHEDHFAAFSSEAKQGGKVISVLTSNPQTALLAKKFGFVVMASGASKTKPAGKAKSPSKKIATLATAPPPGDFSIPDFNDSADLGDVPLTSDQTQGSDPADTDDVDPLRNMHIEDEKGNIVDENEDSASFVASLTATAKVSPRRMPLASDVDGVRLGMQAKNLSPASKSEKPASVPVQKGLSSDDVALGAGSDYIDTVWRGLKNRSSGRPLSVAATPSFFKRTWSSTARIASGASMPKRVALTLVVSAAIVLGSVVYLMTGKAHVALVPVSKAVDIQIIVQASDVFTAVDDAFAKIPGQLLDVSKTAEHMVTATGTRDVASKARGKITVYNEYSSSPQTLVTNTRFGSSTGKVYRTLQSVVIPGSTVSASKTVAGTLTVDVIADAPGTEYNIPAGKFIIVAFQEKGDTNKVQSFYGVSDAAMTGGASGPSVVVTQANYDAAKNAATSAVQTELSAALFALGADLQVLEANKSSITSVTSSANPDDAAQSVTVTVVGGIKTIAFRKKDLQDLIAGAILKKEHLVVNPEQLQLSFSDVAFKADIGTLLFTVSIQGKGYSPINTETIQRDIAGKSAPDIRDYFRNKEGVESATVSLSPFWVRSVPSNIGKIDVQLLFNGTSEGSR